VNVFNILSKPGKKFVLLIDPDKYTVHSLIATIYSANELRISAIFVGGSLVSDRVDSTIEIIRQHTSIPVILFPGSLLQLNNKADAILLLSLISGRNPEYLIGNHVLAAPYLKKSGIEVIPTAYILIGHGNPTSVEYISNTRPIPADKFDLVIATAIAGEMMGNKLIYLESGSGASKSLDPELIKEVKRQVTIPVIVGGGIRSPEQIRQLSKVGADVIVVGNAVENNLEKLEILVRALG
jgi:phosphoglycerol geranylgeranyltransferase